MNHAEQPLNYSIHTIELKRRIPLHTLGEWKQKLYILAAQRKVRTFQNTDNEYIFLPYIHQGVNITLGTAQSCGFLKLTINLNSLLYLSPQRVALFYPINEHIAALDFNLRHILQDASLGSPESFEFSVWISVSTPACSTHLPISSWRLKPASLAVIRKPIGDLITRTAKRRSTTGTPMT